MRSLESQGDGSFRASMMATEELEVLKLYKIRLQDLISEKGTESDILFCLKKLDAVQINISMLKNTGVGLTVTSLKRKYSDTEVDRVSQELVNKWKETVRAEQDQVDSALKACHLGDDTAEPLAYYDLTHSPEAITLEDDDEDMDQGSPRIPLYQKKDMEQICNSVFGQRFLKQEFLNSYGWLPENLGTVLEMLKRDEYACINEAANHALKILDSFIDHFAGFAEREPDLNGKITNSNISKGELICMADHLKDRFAELLDQDVQELQSGEITEDAIMYKLIEIFPDMDREILIIKTKKYLETNTKENNELSLAVNEISQELLNEPAKSAEILRFPLYAPEEGKYHNFEEPEVNHYYVAASQFYQMLLKKTSFPNKPVMNQGDALASIEHIVNSINMKIFNAKALEFKEGGKGLTSDGKNAKEILLFHGTDSNNVESIFENNFYIDWVSNHKKKLMIYGRGVYMSEHPEVALGYGNTLLLCRVRVQQCINHN